MNNPWSLVSQMEGRRPGAWHAVIIDRLATSMDEYARYGGIIPEIASRALESFLPTLGLCPRQGREPWRTWMRNAVRVLVCRFADSGCLRGQGPVILRCKPRCTA